MLTSPEGIYLDSRLDQDTLQSLFFSILGIDSVSLKET